MSTIKITAPFDCEVKGLHDVPDVVFAEKVLGDGVAALPLDDEVIVVAPCDGVLSAFYPTGHAFGLTTEHGAEILVHIGIDTVELEGHGFEAVTVIGAKVKRGDHIVKVDFKKIRDRERHVISPIVVIDAAGRKLKFADVEIAKSGDVLIELEM